MKTDEKTTLKEYRMVNGSGDNKSGSSKSSNIINNDAPWDNNWLSSVTNG